MNNSVAAQFSGGENILVYYSFTLQHTRRFLEYRKLDTIVMPAIKKPKIGTKPANGSKAKDIISRRRNSAAKVTAARRTSRSATKKVSKCSEDDDAEDDEPSYEPSEDEIDGDSAEGDSVARPTKGKNVVANPAEKMTYKKNLRRDAAKFTTSQAMIDAEDEFDPRAAAYRGKATDGGGNGRKKGRRLIRWTAQADQLLLLCLHHELARNKEELPYEAIAQRMFPEKNATGGAIKERFAKLRIECLNRGSWVPPILGKTPQNTRPDVRGVVRLAPGIDRGRFVLWKEDASKLIDPKDINKGHVDAQKKGLQYPERVWISPGAEKEYLKLMNAHKALNLSPIPGPIPTDDDELLSDVDEDEIEAVLDGGVAGPCTPKKRKAASITDSSKKKPSAVAHNTPKKIAAKGRATQADDSDYEGTTAGAGSRKPLPNRPDAGQFKSPVSRPRSRVVTPTVEAPDSDSDAIKTDESSDESDDEDSPANSRLMMMAFDKDEEVRPLRSIVIVRGITPGALSKYPAGIQGPGDDDYGDDDVAENPAVQRDRNGSVTDENNQAVALDKPKTQFVDRAGEVEHDGSTVEQHLNAQDLLRAMKRNTDNNGQVINKDLWENHVQQMNALNGGGIMRNPPQAQLYNQIQIPQYGHQMQNQFAFHGLDPFSGGFGGLQVGFGDYGGDPVVFGDFGFPPVQLPPVSQCGTQEKLSQHNTKNFVDNSLINATKFQMAKEAGPKSNGNVKPDPVLAEFSGLDATLAPAPEDEFFSFGEYDTNGGAAFDESFGAV
ncbi:hypothetical protein V493_06954 [Pseudogymnoascus sp. VKM F-4281 (FW-2241)]|nr:hypothetical protein V493_06954 [Pseudogymnoascus sp. VKM F-4281 (FW-2241)]